MTNPMAQMPGYDAMRAQQEAFIKAMTGGFGSNWSGPQVEDDDDQGDDAGKSTELDEIRAQLAAMQSQLSKMGKK